MCVSVMRARCERDRTMLRCACALAILALATTAEIGKRAESEFLSPMPFLLGSRYGRSEPRMIVPRNDRFIMGTRYGKRSEARSPRGVVCEPAGVFSLFRCTLHPGPPASPGHTYNRIFGGRLRADED